MESGMQFGCSECLCVAMSRIRRRGCTQFSTGPTWCTPTYFGATKTTALQAVRFEFFPILHETSYLTFNDDERCGREQVDVELREPLLEDSDHILMSLRQLALWHSSGNFPAEQMLRESGKFDFSEPHFFHMFGMPAHRQQQSKTYLRWALEVCVTHSIIDVSTEERQWSSTRPQRIHLITSLSRRYFIEGYVKMHKYFGVLFRWITFCYFNEFFLASIQFS